MKKIRLSEKELVNLIKKIIKENDDVTFDDWMFCCRMAENIQDWWKSSKRDEFFESFQEFLDDDDEGARKSYEKLTMTYRASMKSNLSNGENNPYYKEMITWLNAICDEIDDYAQDVCRIDLTSPDGKIMRSYSVDPEID